MTPLLLPLLLLAFSAPRQEPERPRVGLVLSGGGARGAAHVGVLQVLEDLHVPVDFVVGTSMGSIVGGLYASGYAPDEMARILEEADWEAILSDAPPRDALWFRRRLDDRQYLVDLELGWRDGGPALPPGLISGRNIEAFLERLLLPAATVRDFDRLQLPFRCVATDLADGSEVVFDHGDLSLAIRASMSLPGVFAPVQHDGRFLVDGGIVENVPVGVARGLGADHLIVVDISTPLADPAELRSLVSVTNQVFGIQIVANRARSMGALTAADVAVVPELGDITTMGFERCGDAIRVGRESAQALREQLSRFAVDEATWSAWLARQRGTDRPPPIVHRLVVRGETTLSESVIRAVVTLRTGQPLDADALSTTADRLAGLGLFERVEVEIEAVPGDPQAVDVILRPIEKEWGPHYLRFGLGLESDLRGGGEFDLGIQHTWMPVNSLGGEWRNEAQVGTRTRLYTEFYQPLDAGLRWFIAPSIEFAQDNLPLIVAQEKIAEVNAQATEFGLSLGRNLGRWGEIRTHYGWLVGYLEPEISLPGLLPDRIEIGTGQLSTSLTVDTLDNARFPRRGLVGQALWEFADESLGGDERKSILSAGLGEPWSFGRLTLFPRLEGGTTFDGAQVVGGGFYLGGFQRLSGLTPMELSGNHYGLAVLQSYYQLSERTTRFGLATYLGATAEVGGIWQARDAVSAEDLRLSGSLYLAVDSFIGPAYLAWGFAEGGDSAAYVFIGTSF